MTHLNLPLDDYTSMVKINGSELKSGMMIPQLFKPPIPLSTSGSRAQALLLTSQNLWFERKYGSLHLLLHTLPEFCIKPLDFLLTQKRWFLNCRCSTLPQHMDLVMVWQFELAEGLTLTEDTHLVGL